MWQTRGGGSAWDGVSVYGKQTQGYVEKLCFIIERWELTKWDVKDAVPVADGGGMANVDCPFLVKVRQGKGSEKG